MTTVSMTVNGKPVSADIEDRTLLVYFLRENLRLTGTHIGCDTSQCGACVVHVNGRAVKACSMFAVQAEGAQVTTIEGLARDGKLHPVQEAFRENHGLQCGFCTPGMIMTAVDAIRRRGAMDRETIRYELEGNICRCTGYHNIVSSIEDASKKMSAA
ncbi:MAG: (2Fe-2S)-binding protein [Proteobacteria bacterium]|nr:(2Fe-2S)-binding protein [Pseudomonadota bacterium]